MDTSFRTLYIENLPLNTTEKLLEKLFTNFGTVKHVDLPVFDTEHPLCRGLPRPLAKGYAFVEFASKESADKASSMFNDINYIREATKQQNGEKNNHFEHCDNDINGKAQTNEIYQSILSNLEFKRLLLLRVMPKSMYHDLTRKYNDTRLQSLIGAAKLLVVT